MRRLRYLSTLAFDDTWLDRLRAECPDVDVVQIAAEKVSDVPDETWQTVDVLHTSAVCPDPADVPRLRWVQLDTSGVDHLRDHPVWTSDVAVTTIGGVSPVPLAEFVVMSILGLAHRWPAVRQVWADRSWPGNAERFATFMPAPVAGATVTIVGYGRIGREIGRLAHALGMRVVGVSRTGLTPDEPTRAAFVDHGRGAAAEVDLVGPEGLHGALARADYAVVVVPLTDATRNMIDARAIDALKPGAAVINVARGGIVDEDALLAAVRSGRVSGAVLDVFDAEPLPPDSPWWDEPNVVVTPHVSGLAPRYAEQVLGIVSTNLRRFAAGEPLLNLVDRERGY